MKSGIYSLILFCLLASASPAQPMFKSIDSLLTKNFEAVSLRDSAYYLSLLNLPAISQGKKLKNRSDSLKLVKPFTDAFSEMSKELRDFAGSDDVEVKYESYTSANTPYYDSKVNGRIMIQVSLLINNTFTVKLPFFVMGNEGVYTIEHPMLVMFSE
jgi:hypothetical protein